jgi:hypothetical protein
VHVFSAEGTYLRQLGKKGHAEGHFQSPEGITSGPGPHGKDNETLLYVCDTGNDRVQASISICGCRKLFRLFIDLSEGTQLNWLFPTDYKQNTK